MKRRQAKVRGLRDREGNWHYRFELAGQEYTGNTELAATSQNVNDALAVREKERQRILRGDSPAAEICPFSKAAADFLIFHEGQHRDKPATSDRTRTSFASLTRFFRNEPLQNIRASHLEDFMTWRRAAHIKDVTIRHDLHAMSLFLQWAEKRGFCARNVVRDIEMPSDADSEREYILTPDEEAIYFAECLRQGAHDLHDLGRLMLLQGCRPEELMELPSARVDLAGRAMKVQHGKSKAARRRLRLMEESVEILRKRMRRGHDWIFPSPVRPGRHITKLNNPHNRVCGAIDIDFVLYDFRHTFATRMAEKGCDIATLAKILGHGNLRSVMRYVHIGQESSDAAMDKYGKRGVPGRSVRFPSGIGQQNEPKPSKERQRRRA